MPCACPAPPPRRLPCPSCSPRSRSTTTAAPATTSFRPGSSCSPRSANPPRPAARAIRELQDVLPYADGAHRPYIHLVDGGVSDNLGMRGVLDALEFLEALHDEGHADTARPRAAGSSSSSSIRCRRRPPTGTNRRTPPGTMDILLKATGVPIDHYSYEAVEQLKDIAARWQTARELRKLAGCSTNKDSPVCAAIRPSRSGDLCHRRVVCHAPRREGARLPERQPTSFVLPPEAVDRLRAAAGTIILASPEFQRLLKDVGAKVVADPSASGNRAASPPSPNSSLRKARQSCDTGGASLHRSASHPFGDKMKSNAKRLLLSALVAAALGAGVAHGKECKGVNFPDQAQVEGDQSDAQRSRLAPGDDVQGQRLRRARCTWPRPRAIANALLGSNAPSRTDPAVRAQRRRRRPPEGLERGIREEFQGPAARAEGPHRHAQRLDGRRENRRAADLRPQAGRGPPGRRERRGEGHHQGR